MNDTEMQGISRFLLDCQEAVCERDGDSAMTLYLNRLYQVVERVEGAMSATEDQQLRLSLALLEGKAQTLRQKVEQRLAVRN